MEATRGGRSGRVAAARVLTLALATALVSAAAAPPPARQLELGRQEFSRKFDTRRVAHTFRLTTDRPLTTGARAELRIGLTTQLSGIGLGQAARAGLADGYLALALPPALHAVGALRLFYVDASGQEQLLYSAEPPQLARYKALGAPPDLASAGNVALFDYFGSLAHALDPLATVFAPAGSDLRRTDAANNLLTAAWLLPADVHQRRLLDLFDPQAAGAAPEVVARLQVTVTGDPAAAQLKLYAGALSCAAAVIDIPPGLAPPGALPLSELDPPAHPAPKSSTKTSTKGRTKGGDATQLPAAPTLVYSCAWVNWEDSLPLTPRPAAPPAALAIPDLPVVDGAPSTAYETSPATIDLDQAAAAGDAAAGSGGTAPPASGEAATATTGSTARQVQVGTLPAPGGANERPLQPITGSAGQRGSQQDSAYPGPPGGGNPLPPPPGFAGNPGTVRYYGPGGPDNAHGGAQAPPPLAPPGLGSMVLVPAGEFIMGTDAGTPYGDADELPQHRVNLPAFLIDKYPVTNRQFAQFVVSSAYQPEGDWQRYNSPALLDLPVRSVTWNDANAYAKWAGKRLPTEAEWEKAARGTDGRLYPWGNEWNAEILPRGEFNYALVTAPKAASPYGALAMCGVLWQWTASPWHDYPFDPNARGDKLILRGGAFSNGRNIVRCANRYFEAAGVALNTFTFRCVKDAK